MDERLITSYLLASAPLVPSKQKLPRILNATFTYCVGLGCAVLEPIDSVFAGAAGMVFVDLITMSPAVPAFGVHIRPVGMSSS